MEREAGQASGGTGPGTGNFGRWDLGAWLDSILRSMNEGEREGLTVYCDGFRGMLIDGFVVKAMLLALKHPGMFCRELGLQGCTMH